MLSPDPLLEAHTERVKAVDLHPTETWVLAALHNGTLIVYDYTTNEAVKHFEVTTQPLRCARFIVRVGWVVCAGDDLKAHIFDVESGKKIRSIDAHKDSIRATAVNLELPLILTASDDGTVKCWNWEKDFALLQTFRAHGHYVMSVAWNPSAYDQFASVSLDKTIKFWTIPSIDRLPPDEPSVVPDFVLHGHEEGINSVAFAVRDNAHFVTASNDLTVRIWDYQTKRCIKTLTGHTENVCDAVYHPELPLIISCSEDGAVKLWDSQTYEEEPTHDYDAGRLWSISTKEGSHDIALGSDSGTLVLAL